MSEGSVTLSYDLLLVVLLAAGALASLVLIAWRFTGMIARISEYAGRFSERNDLQRDRVMMMLIEKWQIHGKEAEHIVNMAKLHSAEGSISLGNQLRREVAETHQRKAAERREEVARRQLQEELAKGPARDVTTENDAMV